MPDGPFSGLKLTLIGRNPLAQELKAHCSARVPLDPLKSANALSTPAPRGPTAGKGIGVKISWVERSVALEVGPARQ